MQTIRIERHPEADTRTADGLCSKNELYEASRMHILDVQEALENFSAMLEVRGANHDMDKLTNIDGFYSDYEKTILYGDDFTKMPWYQNHKHKRHHAIAEMKDVNIIDLLENMADIICSVRARQKDSEEFEIEVPSAEILERAYKNTAKMLYDSIEVVDEY